MTRGAPLAHGMSVRRSERLLTALRRCIREFRPRAVVETGTYLGQGSTRLLIEAFGEHPPEVFYTIEAKPEFYAQALRNLAGFPFVHAVWGLSVGREQAEAFIQSDPFLQHPPRDLPIHIDSDHPVAFYLAEVRGALGAGQPWSALPDCWLEFLLPRVRDQRPLVALDSAGGIGWLEFQAVMHLQQGSPFALLLDDVNHVKHYRSLRFVQRDPRFELVDHDFDAGWAVAVFGGAEPRVPAAAPE